MVALVLTKNNLDIKYFQVGSKAGRFKVTNLSFLEQRWVENP